MVDAIQAKSTIPIPSYQTEAGSQSASVVNSPKDEARLTKSAETAKTDFETYLNASDISFVPKREAGSVYDTASKIEEQSAYGQTGGKL